VEIRFLYFVKNNHIKIEYSAKNYINFGNKILTLTLLWAPSNLPMTSSLAVIATAQPEAIRNEAQFDEDNSGIYYMKAV
jgi:hypothetical protein